MLASVLIVDSNLLLGFAKWTGYATQVPFTPPTHGQTHKAWIAPGLVRFCRLLVKQYEFSMSEQARSWKRHKG
jgi:hypothetical protein